MNVSMREFTLEVFRNTCAKCGAKFETLADHCYGTVVYESDAGELRFIDGDADPVWEEVRALVEQATKRSMSSLDDAEMFHRLLPLTFDPPSPGDRFESAWVQRRCPTCGRTERDSFGPYEPPRFKKVEIAAVTHRTWSNMSSDAKTALATHALAGGHS